ncbi:flagellar export protein FliJ [Bacillus sp. AFS073361]|uniref:flagellar export protein FliJ n=1 Tax=Bacillus sp. AFS073361 TaxID=2033511 RepID=UPI000BF4AF39|nr:flagellar export protein FliJ [Bacillus sp. AFS073361]PFP30771.1 flagellar export protein FliJ [Bacillus sp. AFS073361]
MKFKFSFQKVLDFKEKEKEIAQQEYSTIKHKQLELQEQIEGLELEKEKVFNQYNDVHRKRVWEILEVQQGIDHVNLQKKNLEVQSQQIHKEVEQKHQMLIEKSQETKMWNQWKANSKDAFQKQLERTEQVMLDEIAVLRYSRRI